MISSFRQSESRREKDQFVRDLAYKSAEKQLAPIEELAAQNVKMEREIAEQEKAISYRQTRKKLVFEPSPKFLETAPRYIPDSASADEISARCRAAHQGFLAKHALTKQEHEFLWLFLNANAEADIAQPLTWDLAWEFVCNALAPVSEPQYEEAQAESEPAEQDIHNIEAGQTLTREEVDKQDKARLNDDFAHELAPIWQEAIYSLQDSSGLHMADPQRKELMNHWEKRTLNSRRPIPFTVAEIRKTAWQLFGEVIGLTEEERTSWAPEDAHLSADEYRRKYGIYGYASKPFAVTATRTRDVEG
jgi:hypothetical protein